MLDRGEPTLVSRAQVARYAEVSRAAVTNWHRRGPGFPEPVDAKRELFDLDQIVDWLSSRAVPANARQPHEPAGTTYADRVRANAGAQDAEELSPFAAPGEGAKGSKETSREVEHLLFQARDRFRGYCSPAEGCHALLGLLHMFTVHPDTWRGLLLHVESRDGAKELPEDVATALSPYSLSLRALGALNVEDLYRTVTEVALIVSGDEHREKLTAAFDRLFEILDEDRSTGILRTPRSIVETTVGLLLTDATPRHVHDPFCRTGEFLLATDQRLRADHPSTHHRLSGACATVEEKRMARMNLDIHGVEAELLEEAVEPGLLPDLPRADLVITNPPFNQRPPTVFSPPGAPPLDWPTLARWNDRRFPYGFPPESNANFAWLQHVVTMLAPNGRAGVLMPTNAAFSEHQDERALRSAMVEDGAVEGVVAFPDRLFPNTGIPVSLWLLRHPTGSCSEMLFIDAGDMGSMVSRTRRALRPQDIDAIHSVHRSWRHEGTLGDEWSGMGRVVGIDEIRSRDHSLHPPSYITAVHETEGTGAQAAERFGQLTRRLTDLEYQVRETDARVHHLLQEVHRWIP